MKVNEGYLLRKVGDENVVITMGEALSKFNGMIKLNSTGVFIFEKIKEETTMDDLVKAFAFEYELPEDQAKKDIKEFLKSVKSTGMFQD